MIDRLRYVLGALSVVILPPGILFWFVIHPWAARWRKLGPGWTFAIILPPLIVLGAALYHVRARLLGADLGMQWGLIAVAIVLYGGTTWFELRTWKQLSLPTVTGIRELSSAGPGTLLTDGVYRVVRHPRYVSAGIGVIGNALFINHVGVYLMILVIFPAGLVMLGFEERELVARFGDQYRQYQREVPRLVPRIRRP